MSRDIGVNTDPLDVEVYIENGLIKGRIVMNNSVVSVVTNEEKEVDEHILNKYFGHVFLLDHSIPCNNEPIVKHNIKFDIISNDDYEYFDFMSYAKRNNLSMTRRQIYNHYIRSGTELHTYLHNTDKFYDILLTAKEKLMDKVIIILADPQYVTIEYYYNNKTFDNYDIVASINNNMYSCVFIKSTCYDSLIDLIEQHKCPWYICVANYINQNVFTTYTTEEPMFK